MNNYRYAKCCANCDHRTDLRCSDDYYDYKNGCKKNEGKTVFADMVCDDFENSSVEEA